MTRLLFILCCCIFIAGCEPLSLKGEVIDQDLRPIEGAKVQNTRTDSTVYTNKEGKFLLTNLRPDDTLVIMADRYKTETEVLFYDPKRGLIRGPFTIVLSKQVLR
jgi:hypothetical protein